MRKYTAILIALLVLLTIFNIVYMNNDNSKLKKIYEKNSGSNQYSEKYFNAYKKWHNEGDYTSMDTLLDMILHSDRNGGQKYSRSEILEIMGEPSVNERNTLSYLDRTEAMCYQIFFENKNDLEEVTGWTHD